MTCGCDGLSCRHLSRFTLPVPALRTPNRPERSMYNFIQRNKKKMLAVFGVLLMIAFTLPSSSLLNGGRGADIAYGYTSDRTLTRGEVFQARSDWEMLSKLPVW